MIILIIILKNGYRLINNTMGLFHNSHTIKTSMLNIIYLTFIQLKYFF